MKTTKQIQVPVIGGGFNTVTVTETDERKGRRLGTALLGCEEIVTERTDHIEREDAETMTFDFGTIRKDVIKSLVWHNDGFGASVREVRFCKTTPRN